MNDNYSLKVDATVPETDIHYDTEAKLAAEELFRNYPETLLYFASVCCVLFMLIGIPGNLVTIIALAKYEKVRNATAIFIINLHISDLIFCCLIHPISAMTFYQKHWTHGMVMCRVYPLFKYLLNATSIFTVLAISINRYIIVCHPLYYPRIYKRRNMTIMLTLLWMSSLGLFSLSAFGIWGRFDLEPSGGFCTMLKDDYILKSSPKNFFICVAFVGPYLTIAFCYARIWWVVRKTAKKSQKNMPIVRPTHLPVSQTQSDASNDGNTLISFEPSISGNSTPDDDDMGNNSNATTPNEDKSFGKYFKAPFRLTRKEVRSKAPTKRDKKLCTMIVAIMVTFCIFHLPIMVTRIIYKEYKLEPLSNIFAHLLEYSGTCMNPLIYVLMSNEYRQAYKSLFVGILRKFQRY